MKTVPLSQQDLHRAKKAFSTRRVADEQASLLITAGYRPQAGDLVLATVQSLGQHTGIQLRTARRAMIYCGDEILLAYGSRYAPDQFEARLPDSLDDCHLAAAGGVASRVVAAHNAMKPPTRLTVRGVLARADGTPLNLADFALPATPVLKRMPVIAVFGTSMNAGKTTTAASLIRGLTRSGHRVGAAKLTGTGACGDFMAMTDAGAHTVCDFTDAGHVTTWGLSESRVANTARHLIGHLAMQGCDLAVVEIADGMFQRETAALAANPAASQLFDAVLFAAGDSAGAVAGAQAMRALGLNIVGLSGRLSASPLGSHEARMQSGLPVFGKPELENMEMTTLLPDQAIETMALPCAA